MADTSRWSPHATTVAACLASAALGGAIVAAHGRARARAARRAAEPTASVTVTATAPCCKTKADPFDPRPRNSYLSWDDYFMALAFLSAQRSKDPSKQVGACIVSPARIILGIGYNGFPRGCADSRLPWSKRATSGGALATKYPYVCHAEMNAILNKNAANVAGATLYVTMFPCNECSKLLIQAGIREVVFYEDKQASGEPASTPASGGILPSESYAASRTLLDLASVRTRQHAPATPLTLRVDPLREHAKAA